MKKLEFLGLPWYFWLIFIIVFVVSIVVKAYIYKALGVPVMTYNPIVLQSQ